MKPRSTQFGVRENTAFSRQHAPRLATDTRSDPIRIAEQDLDVQTSALENDAPIISSEDPSDAAPKRVATEGEGAPEGQLLTVREVAQMLQVPVSWVYGHIRERCADRIPGFRLGKYWRFSKQDVTAWLREKCTKDYPLAGHSR